MSPSREFGQALPEIPARPNTHGRIRAFPALVWLGFILFPLVDAVTTHASPVAKALTILGATAFVAAYLGLVLMWRQRPWHTPAVALFALLLGTAIALTLASGPGWGFLFTYCAAVVALFSSAADRLALGDRLRASWRRPAPPSPGHPAAPSSPTGSPRSGSAC